MKIDIGKVKRQQEYLQRILINHEEIVKELSDAAKGVVELNDFSGSSADEIKNYFSSAHTEVIKTIRIMIMDLNTKLYKYVEDFNSQVDGSSIAIIDKVYIEGVEKSLNKINSKLVSASSKSSSLISRASKYVNCGTDYYRKIISGYDNAKTKSEAIKLSLENFDNTHMRDMENILNTVDAVNSIVRRMSNVQISSTTSINVGDFVSGKDFERIREYQITTASAIIEMNEDNMDKYLQTFANMMIPIGALGTSVDEGRNFQDIVAMYKANINFELCKNNNGEMIYKLITDEKNIPAIRNKLEALGLENLTRKNINEMLRNGLKVVNTDGHKVNSKIVKQLEKLKGFRSDYDDIAKAANTAPGTITRWTSYVDKFGKVVTVGVNGYENIYNPMTDEIEFTGEGILGTVTDTTVDLGMDATIIWGAGVAAKALIPASVAIGQTVIPIPGVGAAIGAVVGVGLTIFLGNKKFGEPPESAYDKIKNTIKYASNSIVDTLGKVFW